MEGEELRRTHQAICRENGFLQVVRTITDRCYSGVVLHSLGKGPGHGTGRSGKCIPRGRPVEMAAISARKEMEKGNMAVPSGLS